MISRIVNAGSYLSALGAATVAVLVTVNVILRLSTGQGIPGAEEASVLLLVIIVFAGFGRAEADETHVRVSLVTDRLPRRHQRVVERVSLSLATVFVFVITYTTGRRAWLSVEQGEVTIGIVTMPVWPSRIAVAFGFLFFALALAKKVFNPRLLDVGQATPLETETSTETRDAHAS